MSGKDDDPNADLAADAALAEDLGDEEERRKEQLAHLGGEEDDIDNEDLSSLDRGDSLETPKDEDEDRGDKVDDDEESDDSDNDSDDEESKDDDDSEEESDDSVDDSDNDSDEEDDDADEGEEDDDADDDGEEEEEDDGKPKKKVDQGIPRSRFNEVNERMKRAEAKIAQLESTDKAKEDAAEEQYDFDAAEENYMALLLDGKTKEAAAQRKEIREAEEARFIAKATSTTKSEVSLDQQQEALNKLSSEAEQMFPMFDENSDDYNQEATDKVIVFMRGYASQGMNLDDAFVAGLADVLEIYNVDTGSQGDGDTKDEDEEKPSKKTRKKKPIKKVKKKLDDAKKQGQTPAGEGKGSADAGVAVPDIEQMTDEELDALPAEKLARLRGDFVD